MRMSEQIQNLFTMLRVAYCCQPRNCLKAYIFIASPRLSVCCLILGPLRARVVSVLQGGVHISFCCNPLAISPTYSFVQGSGRSTMESTNGTASCAQLCVYGTGLSETGSSCVCSGIICGVPSPAPYAQTIHPGHLHPLPPRTAAAVAAAFSSWNYSLEAPYFHLQMARRITVASTSRNCLAVG